MNDETESAVNPCDRSRCLPVSEQAVIQRLNRKLAHEGERMKVNRWGSAAQRQLGRYLTVNNHSNAVTWYSDNLEGLARELAVIQPNETIAEEQ